MSRILNNIKGHDQIVAKLSTAIKNNSFGSCQLFVGPSGIGKKLTALGAIQELMCEQGPPACGACPTCLKIENQQHEELHIIEPEGTQIKIAQCRDLIRTLALQKIGPARAVIINEAKAFNVQAANALLKTLEEPPPSTYFFLITDSEKQLLPTIRSRSHILRFSQLDNSSIKDLTQANDWIVSSSQGRLDLAQQLQDPQFEQYRTQALDVLINMQNKKTKVPFVEIKDLVKDKDNAFFIAKCWQQFLRDSLLLKYNLGPIIHQDLQDKMLPLSKINADKLDKLFKSAIGLETSIHRNFDRTLTFENFLLDLN